jgi:hypothetical protein
VTAIEPIVSAIVPVFRSVEIFDALVVPTAWAANVSEVGDSVMVEVAPVPVRLTLCGLPPALSVKRSVAFRVPVPVGLKVTVAVQVAPAGSVAGLMGHVFVWL